MSVLELTNNKSVIHPLNKRRQQTFSKNEIVLPFWGNSNSL
jgi:hypothetical protein